MDTRERRVLENVVKDLCEVLNQENVRYVIIGGVAVILHGYLRTTEDVDVLFDSSENNLQNLKKALYTAFKDDSINELSHEDFAEYAVVRYGTSEGYYIDLVTRIGEVADYADVAPDVEWIEMGGVRIPIASAKWLLRLKKDSLRERDRRDARFLKWKLDQRNNSGDRSGGHV